MSRCPYPKNLLHTSTKNILEISNYIRAYIEYLKFFYKCLFRSNDI